MIRSLGLSDLLGIRLSSFLNIPEEVLFLYHVAETLLALTSIIVAWKLLKTFGATFAFRKIAMLGVLLLFCAACLYFVNHRYMFQYIEPVVAQEKGAQVIKEEDIFVVPFPLFPHEALADYDLGGRLNREGSGRVLQDIIESEYRLASLATLTLHFALFACCWLLLWIGVSYHLLFILKYVRTHIFKGRQNRRESHSQEPYSSSR